MSIASASVGDIGAQGIIDIGTSEGELKLAVGALTANSTAAELLAVQIKLNINSTLTAMYSGIIKERADTMKGVAQKF
ncbi:MAG: hypothetical protein H7238_12480 [Polaromonas sp.]|nr:hypothetical protein [Polaromonas sp.]